jgi:hypothetical protein
MIRVVASCGLMVATLAVCAGPAPGEDDPADVLTDKGLHPSGAVFLAKGEDDVKKAWDAAEAKLREYRRASAQEKDFARTEAEKKGLAENLKRERAAMKQQLDQILPQLRAQAQALSQQRAALGMQYSGSRYRYGNVQSNQLSSQISALNNQANQLNAEYNDLGARINYLSGRPDNSKAAPTPFASSADKREAYAKALEEVRKQVDATRKAYEEAGKDPQVKSALDALNQRSAKIKHTLGPSKKFEDSIKALEKAEAKLASGEIDEAPTQPASRKAKSKAARKR